MYQYVGREKIQTSDGLSVGLLVDNEGRRETVSYFLERDTGGFLVRYRERSILVKPDWRNCIVITGAYPGELCLLPIVPAFRAAMLNWFHKSASKEFQEIVYKIFSLDYEESD